MTTITRRATRAAFGMAIAATAALALSACSGSANADPSGGSGVDAKTATSLAAFGSLSDLEKATEKEGTLNVIALPHDW
ncbi:MAG: ABC transporter substrate-binding protein, partial [Microbacterium sp.]|nr:ABC transporter substrate-binding protein [Microbacterium sp.]